MTSTLESNTNYNRKNQAMGKEDLIRDNIDIKTWQGYVVGLLETMSDTIERNKEESKEDIDKVNANIEKILNKLESYNNNINKLSLEILKHDSCGIDDLKKTIYGEPDGKDDGLLGKFNKLSLEFKIKSGYWGLLGGMVPILIIIVIGAIKTYHSGG